MAKVPAGTGDLQLHELVYYVPGEMNDEEFTALVASIKASGQQTPITLLDGKILDGRHRYKACVKLGIKPVTETLKAGVDPVQFVMNANLHRRQLNSMQKAMVAARMYTAPDNTVTQEALAQSVGVGKGTINLAVRLIESKNTPLIKRTERGDTTRAEIDEVLYDRTVANSSTPTTTDIEETDDPIEDRDPLDITAPGEKATTTGSKVPHPERHATETTPSKLAGQFRKLSALDKTSFIQIAWAQLEPALVAAGKLSDKPTKVKLDPVANKKPKKKSVAKKKAKA